jgi:hypothetical protein
MAEMKFNSVGPVVEEGVSQVTATPSVELGTRRYYKGEEYVYCYNSGGAQASVNLGVKFVTGASGYSIAQTSVTDVFNPCVGVVKHSTMAAADYGWVMVKGFSNVKLVSASTADYKMIALGAAGSFIEASGTTTLGTAVAVGYLLSHNTAAAGTAYAFIRTNA